MSHHSLQYTLGSSRNNHGPEVHADYAGPLFGKMFPVLIEAHSKWMEVHITSSATSSVTIDKMRTTFASLGVPEILVMDNGSAFTSGEFEQFVKANGFKHVRTAPYHPCLKWFARAKSTDLKRWYEKTQRWNTRDQFFFSHRLTPQTTTSLSPFELLFGHRLCCHLDFLHPNLPAKVHQCQS